MDAAASGGSPVLYARLINEYLNEAYRNNPGTGCPFGALAGEIARSDKRTRARAVSDETLSLEIMKTVVEHLKDSASWILEALRSADR